MESKREGAGKTRFLLSLKSEQILTTATHNRYWLKAGMAGVVTAVNPTKLLVMDPCLNSLLSRLSRLTPYPVDFFIDLPPPAGGERNSWENWYITVHQK